MSEPRVREVSAHHGIAAAMQNRFRARIEHNENRLGWLVWRFVGEYGWSNHVDLTEIQRRAGP